MRTGTNLFISVAALAALLASPAEAQRTGSRIGKNVGQEDVGRLTQILAECIADRRPKMVRTWLNMLPGTDTEFQFVKRQEGDLGICLEDDQLVLGGDQQIVFKPQQFRYPVALAIVRTAMRKSNHVPATLNPEGKAWFAAPVAALPKGAEVDGNALLLQDFGHCVASTNWVASRELVLAEDKSPEERRAVKSLLPVLGPCMMANSTIKLTPANLRASLAEPMLHILAPAGG